MASSNLPSSETLNVIDFPQQSGVLSALDLEITESSVATLLSQSRIQQMQLTNCLTEIFVDRAWLAPKNLMSIWRKQGKVVGALHGLPISLKDQISIKGIESTMGYISLIGQVAEKNSVLVDILESLVLCHSSKRMFPRHSCGQKHSIASSEAAVLLVEKVRFVEGQPLGVGSDIGGSIRIPAGLCGVYGFRPSYNRIPYGGCVNSMEGQDSILSVLGPLSSTLDGIQTFFKAVISKEPWQMDPMTIRKRWSEEEYNLIDHGNGKKLCFAILWDNGLVEPHPPIRRGLEMTRDALVAAGHQVIDWKPYKQKEILGTIEAIWGSASTEDFRTVLASSGEPLITSMKLAHEEGDTPFLVTSDTTLSAFALWQLHKKKHTISQTATGRPVDAVISPVAPHTALQHGWHKNGHYTMPWNLLSSFQYPKVDQALDVKQPGGKFYTAEDRKIHELMYNRYDPATYENAPISNQVVKPHNGGRGNSRYVSDSR
ncbi:hypothetical protein MSAN_02139400 [Mycena sanguinolenta]|uniref:Amidase domain-containing protein n=1 Tax=Mycena sanguinolenta TaxID=230812 RepID=A0A8H6XF22_9AGAR|nr:hypothetical protein MSAN_02139400 [Mycena sanguinolenta]